MKKDPQMKRNHVRQSIAKATYEFWSKGSAKRLTAQEAFDLARKGLSPQSAVRPKKGSAAATVRHLRDYGPRHSCEACDL